LAGFCFDPFDFWLEDAVKTFGIVGRFFAGLFHDFVV